MKSANKRAFADWFQKQQGSALDPAAVLDVQVKRLHEYKRQLLCAMSSKLELIGVTKRFDKGTPDEKLALDHLSLTVQPGDFVTILGSNGAGKSTLFNAILGSFFTDEGRILLDGEDITFQKQHKRAEHIGCLFQNPLRGTAPDMYGNPETTPGGRALKYYASVRLDVRRIETLKSGDEMIGNRTRVKVVKNKVAPPFKEAQFDIIYGEGISRVGELIDLGVQLEIIEKAGAWYTCCGERIQGREGLRDFLLANPDKADKVESEIRTNAYKLLTPQALKAAKAAGRAIDVTADDFDDGGEQ